MNWYDLAALCFVSLITVKFVVGMIFARIEFEFEFDAFHDIVFCLILCGTAAYAGSIDGSWVTAAAVAFFASTLWAAISVFKNSTLLQIYRGRGR